MRRVVADPADAEAGARDDRFEVRDVLQRVQMVRLAQALLRHVDQADPLEPAGERVDGAQPLGDRRVLADVRVDEERAAGGEDAGRLGEHRVQRLGRQVLEDVERVGLGEGAVRERQLAQVGEREVGGGARLVREERADVDAGERGAARRVPQDRASAAAAEVDHAIARRELQEAPQLPLPHARLQERRRDRLVPRVLVQGLVQVFGLLGERRPRPQVQVVARRLRIPSTALSANQTLSGHGVRERRSRTVSGTRSGSDVPEGHRDRHRKPGSPGKRGSGRE